MKPEWAAVWVAGGALFVSVAAVVAAVFAAKYTRDQARVARAQLESDRVALERASAAPWLLTHFQNDAFAIVNRGPVVLFDVRVVIPDLVQTGPMVWEMVDASATGKFFVPRTEAPAVGAVEVQWRDFPDSPVRSWRSELPPRA